MKLKTARTKSSAVQDEYQPFLSQPTLYIPNPPPTVKLEHIASALTGYGTSIHSIFLITVKQRPRLGKFSGRCMRRKWVRLEFASIEMAEQAYVTLHRRPIPSVTPQVLLNFRFTPYFPSVSSNLMTALPTTSLTNTTSALQSKAVEQTRKGTRHRSGKSNAQTSNVNQNQRGELPPPNSSQNNTFMVPNTCCTTHAPNGCTRFSEAIELDVNDSGQEEVEDYNSERVLYPIDEETEEGDLQGKFMNAYSDGGSFIQMLHKLDSFDDAWHEIDTANTTAEPDPPVPLKSDLSSPARSLKRTHSNISCIPREAVPLYLPQEDDALPEQHYSIPSKSNDAQINATSLSESLSLIDSQTTTINALRKNIYDLFKAADSQTLIIERLRKLIRQLEWDKSDLLGMLECTKETGVKQLKLLQVQLEEIGSRMELIEARLELAETKCRLFEVNGGGLGAGVSQREKTLLEDDTERRKLSELEESCRRLASMIAHDAHRKHLDVRRDRVHARERLISEQARRLREQEERNQILMKEDLARKVLEMEDRQRREKDRRRRLRREQAESKERKRCRERDFQLWGTGEWTDLRALERFKVLLAEFESVAFTEDQPLTMGVIPWPILTDPFEMDTEDPGKTLEELEWGMVEVFFKEVSRFVGVREYRSLLERTNMAFHPDRWKARRMLDTVVDDEVRGWLEAKGIMVAQAVTPLWRESKQNKM
ncbi:hypothetical protein E1B28_005837 [Marasmius oreades]|uniref:Uncharacterized protein n=1 Tax=Marasmius oreades TaxID=181124 RepID=A0A9P7S4P5_9AGAR|nr:uncharacterized protein E1B28_005837 [Marasmius oreades]KAG7095047.1 hypothetical protein E1B28_005837 [Marasmius oreades]